MTPGRAKGIVLVSIFTATTVASLADLGRARLPRPTIVVGGFATAIALSAMAEATPATAAAFGAMIATGAIVGGGPDAFETIAKTTTTTTDKAPS